MTPAEMERERLLLAYVNKHVVIDGNIIHYPAVAGVEGNHRQLSPWQGEDGRIRFLEEERCKLRERLRPTLQELFPIQATLTAPLPAPLSEPTEPEPTSPAGIAAGILKGLGEEFYAFVRRSHNMGGACAVTDTRSAFKEFLRALHEPQRDAAVIKKMLEGLVMRMVALYTLRLTIPVLKKTETTKEEAWRILEGAMEALSRALNSEHTKEVEHRKALAAQLEELQKQEDAARTREVESEANLRNLSDIRESLSRGPSGSPPPGSTLRRGRGEGSLGAWLPRQRWSGFVYPSQTEARSPMSPSTGQPPRSRSS